jgi:hypothetical protein
MKYKEYNELEEKDIDLICDYLLNPSTNANQDKQRRKELYDLNIVKKTKTNETNQKYLSGPLGEAIVRLYFDKIDKIFIPKPPEVKYFNSQKELIVLRPDGLHVRGEYNIWIESKMRSYFSDGTAHEKIHGVPEKYCHMHGKLMLFLLADDEHKYNKNWTKLRRGEILPQNKCEEYHMLGDLEVLDSIVLGTEVAKVLKA